MIFKKNRYITLITLLLSFGILTLFTCESKKVKVVDGLWGVYKIEYNNTQDLINEKRKTLSIVDRNLYIVAKKNSFLLELFGNNIKGTFDSYIKNGKIFIN